MKEAHRRIREAAESKSTGALGISALYECASYSQSVFTAGVACRDHTTSSRLLAAPTACFYSSSLLSSCSILIHSTPKKKKKEKKRKKAEILFH